MQRYELVEGASSKFWEAEVAGSDLTVRFGRIGTAGKVKCKAFTDGAAAQRELEKLIREKTGKGYSLAGTVSAIAVQAPAPVPKPPTVSAVAVAETVDPASPAAVDSAIAWPIGGFQWKAEWRTQLPIVRGIHAPTPEPVQQVPSPLVLLAEDPYGQQQANLDALAKAVGRSWTYWGPALSHERLSQEALAEPDFERWLEMLAQVHCGQWRLVNLVALARACVDLHGLPFSLTVALAFWQSAADVNGAWQGSMMFAPLREAIACASEADYQQAQGTAEPLRSQNVASMQACAHLFAHRGDWAAEAVAQQLKDPLVLLQTCSMPAQDFVRYLKANPRALDQRMRSALLLQVHLHGEDAFDALAAVLSQALDRNDSAAVVESLELITSMRTGAVVPLLVSRLDNKKVRDALEKIGSDYPAAVLKTAIEHAVATKDRALEAWTLRYGLAQREALAQALAAVEARARTRFETLLAALDREEAPASSLPWILREPPWVCTERAQVLPEFDMPVVPMQDAFTWTLTQLREMRDFVPYSWDAPLANENGFPGQMHLKPSGYERLMQGLPLEPGDLPEWMSRFLTPGAVLLVPAPARLALWNSYPASGWSKWDSNITVIHTLLRDYQGAAMPGVLAYIKANPEQSARIIEVIDSPLLVDSQVATMRRGKRAFREGAAQWLRAHHRTVLAHLLPAAFRPGATLARDDARFAIRWLAAQGFDGAALEAAACYGGPMPQALDALLRADPLALLPGVIPKLPAFFQAAAFRRPELRDGGALPTTAMQHLGTLLALSQLDAPHAGIAVVREACTPASLAEFAWDVFEAWAAAGASNKEAWALGAIGLFGDDDTARRLSPRIRDWFNNSAPAKALTALDVLAAIGSDVALSQLSAFANQNQMKPLRRRAAEMISAVADARGLTEDELADRLVPNLALDESGALELDYGPRKFQVRFDETMEPYIKDAQGVRLKAIPRQVKTDDAAKASAAIDRFKQIRKDVKATAALQMARLERAMVGRRHWTAQDFRVLFLEHPLMRHLTARLVWAVYEEGRIAHAFRVAEDWTLADHDDAHWELPETATVGIAHVLEMEPGMRDAFSQVFADYEIAQPFKQLARETYAFTAQEKLESTTARFGGKIVFAGSILALLHRGWVRADVDGVSVLSYGRPANDGLRAEVRLDPGTPIGEAMSEPRQKIVALELRRPDNAGRAPAAPFGELDPLLASEVLRDIELLSPAKE